MLEHGGRLRRAAAEYNIPLLHWVDLSTGINPYGWPVPAIPEQCWQRLPEDDDELLAAAQEYYHNKSVLPVAGSQAAIQALPYLRPHSRVGVFAPSYAEHANAWEKAGHEVIVINEKSLRTTINTLDVLIVVNPNNPTGKLWEERTLLTYHYKLQARGGWLIVDEAFIDANDEYSLSYLAGTKGVTGLIVLRSIGKFFGLAGIRCGFVMAEQQLLQQLAEYLGPWTISNPTRYIAAQALADTGWHYRTTLILQEDSQRLQTLLEKYGWKPNSDCELFQWIKHPKAEQLHKALAQQGILTRYFDQPCSIRFGLPGSEMAWRELEQGLARASKPG